jgi:hypothetical protein
MRFFLTTILLFCFAADICAQDSILPVNGNASGSIIGGTLFYWKIPVVADGNLQVVITPSDNANIYIKVCTQDKAATLAYNDDGGNPCTLTVEGLKPADYYVGLSGYFPAAQTHAFTLSNTFTLATLPNDQEPNDTFPASLTLALNGSSTGHIGYDGHITSIPADVQDWYKVTTTADGALRVFIEQARPVNLALTLYHPDGSGTFASHDTWGNKDTVTLANLRPGTYFARVYKYAWNYTSYTLGNGFTQAALANDPEPNDSVKDASPISIGDSLTGHIGYNGYSTAVSMDQTDWWKFSVPAAGIITVSTQQTAGANCAIAVYDTNGTSSFGSADSWGNPVTRTVSITTPGTYYVRVYTYGGFTSYSIKVSGPATGVRLPGERTNATLVRSGKGVAATPQVFDIRGRKVLSADKSGHGLLIVKQGKKSLVKKFNVK